MRKLLLLSFVLFISMGLVAAQEAASGTPKSVAECLKAVQEYVTQQSEAAKKAGRKADYQALRKQKTELAQIYAAQFKNAELRGKDLLLLAQLYREAEQPTAARPAVDKYLADPSLTANDRADGLQAAVALMAASPYTDENISQAETYLAQLDALDNSVTRQKIKGHASLAGYYSYADMDAPNLAHHAQILTLVKLLEPAARKEFQGLQADAYQSIALVQANRAEVAESLATLKQGLAELPADARERAWLTDALKRYEFIGQPGAALKGDYWLNAEPGQTELDLRGHVTIIQFTAHWCGPCRKSYPAMLKFHEQFAAKGVQVVFSTQLYGFFEKQQNLTPAAEVEADKHYFLEHHKIPFKVAIQAEPKGDDTNTNETKYLVGGIPQIVILDKQGIVRQILVGWDPANEARVTRLIEKLL